MSKENDYRAPRQLPQDRDIGKRSRLQRKFVERLCEWLDAIAHWRIHQRSYVSPVSFDVDADKRELAGIGWQQKHFSQLDGVTKAYWQLHHNEAAQRFKDSPKWATVGKAMYSEKTRYQPYPQLDDLLIWLWPLLKKHNWTYRDLLNVVRGSRPKPLTLATRKRSLRLTASMSWVFANNAPARPFETANRMASRWRCVFAGRVEQFFLTKTQNS